MNERIQKFSVKGIVCKNGKVFMLKDNKGIWELPGGKIDFGEHPLESLKREFLEELGVKEVKIGDVVNVWDFTVNVKSTIYHFIIIVYECEANLSNINISDEHLEYKWIKLDEIHKYSMRDGYIKSIEKYYKNYQEGKINDK